MYLVNLVRGCNWSRVPFIVLKVRVSWVCKQKALFPESGWYAAVPSLVVPCVPFWEAPFVHQTGQLRIMFIGSITRSHDVEAPNAIDGCYFTRELYELEEMKVSQWLSTVMCRSVYEIMMAVLCPNIIWYSMYGHSLSISWWFQSMMNKFHTWTKHSFLICLCLCVFALLNSDIRQSEFLHVNAGSHSQHMKILHSSQVRSYTNHSHKRVSMTCS